MAEEITRREKLAKIRKMNLNPFPYAFARTHTTKKIKEDFDQLAGRDEVKVAGRIMTRRDHGKTSFCHIRDGSGDIQIYFRQDILKERYEILSLLDLGDFIGVSGEVFKTKTGEITILVKDFSLLAKSLLPLPEKWHGLKDIEKRYRLRYLDLITNPEAKEVIIKRMEIINLIRNFLFAKGFVEVETPILQPIYGGAFAQPFKTHYSALEQEMFLRISDELYLKRLIIGGLEKVFEIGKDFRNEGIDRFHSPEFTQIEIYEAYKDYKDFMVMTEELFRYLAKELTSDSKIYYLEEKRLEQILQPLGVKEAEREEYLNFAWEVTKLLTKGEEGISLLIAKKKEKLSQNVLEEILLAIKEMAIDFSLPFQRISFVPALQEKLGKDPLSLPLGELIKCAKDLGLEVGERPTQAKLLDKLFSSLIQPELIQPTFVYDHPRITTPLAKVHRENPELVERFEPIVCGMELGNAFSEENDPIRERERFLELIAQKEEYCVLDEDFLSALEYGMPPTAGLGLGIDRIVMLFTASPAIRDVIPFPQLRKKEDDLC
ncbi:MAG: lysine--tRNA ligase [candidate division WOR-3 bacterium]